MRTLQHVAVQPEGPETRTEMPLVRLQALRALVLLGGSVRPSRFAQAIGRPLYELPLAADCTLLDAWRRAAEDLSQRIAGAPVPVRVMIDRAATEPSRPAAVHDQQPRVQIERDPFDYRGTGGVLRDVAMGYGDDDLLLVATAAQVLLEPLAEIAAQLAEADGDVRIIAHRDGTPSATFLIRCGALRNLPASGFVDFKEQALPAIARSHRITLIEREHPTALPVRTLSDYTNALRWHHQLVTGRTTVMDPYAETWESSFAIVEDGAIADPAARLHDSVVLRDGRVEAEAVLVHSIVCPGGVLRRHEMRIDSLVTPAENGRHRS